MRRALVEQALEVACAGGHNVLKSEPPEGLAKVHISPVIAPGGFGSERGNYIV
jgi:hypothetical protein